MAQRELTYEDLVKLVDLIKSTSHFSEFRLKVGDIEVSLRRAAGSAPRVQPAVAQHEPISPAQPKTQAVERQFPKGMHLLRAPMVGTFYRKPEPSKPAFVEPGQNVEPDTVVCIIEVMKLMNSIEAGIRGTVREVVVENAAAIEHGQVLMVIEPR